jgi:hypothetical protein
LERHKEVFALLVAEGLFDNFQIWDVTDPTNPVPRGTWGAERICDPAVAVCTDPISVIQTWLSRGRGTSTNRFLHDVWASDDGETAYLSNWDAGMVILDISDVDEPVFLSAAPFAGPDDEGNSHSAVPARGGRLVIETGEDFEHRRLAVKVVDGPLSGSVFGGVEDVAGPPPPRFADVGVIGPVEAVFVGRGCDTDNFNFGDEPGIFDPYLSDPTGKVAVIRSGSCSSASKLARAEAAGAVAVLVAGTVAGEGPRGDGAFQNVGGIPAMFLSAADGDTFEGNPTGAIVVIDPSIPTFNPWGFVRIYDTSDPADPVLLSTFHTTNSLNLGGPPDPRGTYSVHNAFVQGDTAFFSWYSDGVVVLDISQPDAPREIGRFNDTSSEFEARNGGIQNVWGVYVSGDLIFASDRNGGLYVLKLVS